MKASFKRFWLAISGATSIEYAVIAGGIAVAIAAATTTLGANVSGLFNTVLAALK